MPHGGGLRVKHGPAPPSALMRLAELHGSAELPDLAEPWGRTAQGGCIIRAVFLDDIYQAYKRNPALENLMMDQEFGSKLVNSEKAWRSVVIKVHQRIPLQPTLLRPQRTAESTAPPASSVATEHLESDGAASTETKPGPDHDRICGRSFGQWRGAQACVSLKFCLAGHQCWLGGAWLLHLAGLFRHLPPRELACQPCTGNNPT